jgi:hypothetical protein
MNGVRDEARRPAGAVVLAARTVRVCAVRAAPWF